MLRSLALILLLGLAPALAAAHPHGSGAKPGARRAVRPTGNGMKRGKQRAPEARRRRPVRRPRRGRIVAKRAASLVGVSLGEVSRAVPDDCTGLVRLAYQRVGVELAGSGLPGDNGVTAIHRRAAERKALHRRRPRQGDLVFFRETYDRNRDGLRNDGLTHIGVVESVGRNGTVIFVHRGGNGVKRSRLNLRHPARRGSRRQGFLNDWLRRATGTDRAYLTGELFAGFASADRM